MSQIFIQLKQYVFLSFVYDSNHLFISKVTSIFSQVRNYTIGSDGQKRPLVQDASEKIDQEKEKRDIERGQKVEPVTPKDGRWKYGKMLNLKAVTKYKISMIYPPVFFVL